MPERKEKLRETVNELEAELQTMESLDPETRAMLAEAAAEIQAALQKEDADQDEHHSLTERLRDSVHEFEADHPTLAVRRLYTRQAQTWVDATTSNALFTQRRFR